jgi:hypothetical protein
MLNKVQGPLAWNINASITRAAFLLPFTSFIERGDSAQRGYCFSRKALRGIQFSFKEQTEFNKLTKLLDRLVSNMKDSLTKAAVFLPFTFRR